MQSVGYEQLGCKTGIFILWKMCALAWTICPASAPLCVSLLNKKKITINDRRGGNMIKFQTNYSVLHLERQTREKNVDEIRSITNNRILLFSLSTKEPKKGLLLFSALF